MIESPSVHCPGQKSVLYIIFALILQTHTFLISIHSFGVKMFVLLGGGGGRERGGGQAFGSFRCTNHTLFDRYTEKQKLHNKPSNTDCEVHASSCRIIYCEHTHV